MHTLGKFLQSMRKKRRLSQQDVANKLGISRPTYFQIENDERDLSLTEADKISKILGIHFEDLLQKKEPIKENIVIIKNVAQKKSKHKEKQLRISVPQKHIEKFKEILLYILEKVGSKPNVGMTVLYKLLYFIDFDFYEKFEEQLIGATYIKNHYGPTPIEFKKVIEQMIKNNDLEEIKSNYFKYPQTKYLPLRKANLSTITAIEKDHIDEVLTRLANKSAKELSGYSHNDIPWITAKNNEPIDYEAVFYRTELTSVRQYE